MTQYEYFLLFFTLVRWTLDFEFKVQFCASTRKGAKLSLWRYTTGVIKFPIKRLSFNILKQYYQGQIYFTEESVSPNGDYGGPLKKRRFARESLTEFTCDSPTTPNSLTNANQVKYYSLLTEWIVPRCPNSSDCNRGSFIDQFWLIQRT